MNKKTLLALLTMLASPTGFAGEVKLTIEIPRLEVAEYHKPYVASWIQAPDGTMVKNLSVWYDTDMKDAEGEKWLKDIRQWWRKSGRSLKMPVDGVSGPTKPVGTHTSTVPVKVFDPETLPAGDYEVVVEASREVGGREMLRLPFKWDGHAAVDASTQGKTELGKIKFTITP